MKKSNLENRANELKEKMIEAIKKCDANAFRAAYDKSFRYLKASERHNYYMMFISHMAN